MADKTFLDEEDQIDLELDVPFNEFDDEYPPDTQPHIKPSSKQSNGTANNHDMVQNATSCKRASDKLSLENTLLNITEVTINKEPDKNDEEEGELLSQDEEMELLEEDPVDNSGEHHKNTTCLAQEKKDLKRKIEDQRAEADMDIEEGLLLESDDESGTQGKKCKKEDNGVHDTSAEDQPMKRKTRGGKKKKKKPQVRPAHYGKVPRPIIGRLFRPMIATEHDAPEVLAGQIAERLEEEKEDLILQVLKTIGNKKGMEIFQETKKIQVHGGMNTAYGNRRRTSGGIFLYILKSKGYATKEQLKEIFAVEREKAKQLVKEQKKRERELKEQGIQDLRQRLADKRETLLKTETNETENGNSLEIT